MDSVAYGLMAPIEMIEPYNPLDKLNLGRSVSEALLLSSVRNLSSVNSESLIGAGVYAIYYSGPFPPYEPVSIRNRENRHSQPIYVGKAIPRGRRKGGIGSSAATGRALRDRLLQHSNSIIEASNLEIADFTFRSLVVDDIWIPLGENMMIDQYKPIWNLVIDGFGNKDPGRRRATQYCSPWDVLHPGRKFTEKLAPHPYSAEVFIEKLTLFFAGKIPDEALLAPDDQELE